MYQVMASKQILNNKIKSVFFRISMTLCYGYKNRLSNGQTSNTTYRFVITCQQMLMWSFRVVFTVFGHTFCCL